MTKKVVARISCVMFVSIGTICWVLNKAGIIEEEIFINCSIGLVSLIISIVSAFFVVIELRDTKRIQEAEFILNLNQVFVDNEQYAQTYTKLESRDPKAGKLSNIEISNYLTFFETVYILLMENVVNINVLDDLFGYRFFLAVHNLDVQNMKLVESPQNFRNIYKLEKIWMDYRVKEGLDIFKIENSLEQACRKKNKENEYNKIMKKNERKDR